MQKEHARSLLESLTAHAYSRSELLYQIGLLKSFCEFVFFTKQKEQVTRDLIEPFGEAQNATVEEVAFLKRLPTEFFKYFEKESFYDLLEALSLGVEELQTLGLEVPVSFTRKDLATLGEWARENIDPHILLTVKVNTALSVGCRFTWGGMYHDFSLMHYFERHREALHKKLKLPTNNAVAENGKAR